MEQHIEQLKKEQTKAQHELDTIEKLKAEFPDLEVDTDRWGCKRYMAKSANARVTDVVFHRNCGCCSDSPVHARPYLKLEDGTTIYSNPCNVMIGEPTWGGGFWEYEDWEKRYWEAALSLEAVKTIRRYIDRETEEEDDD
jgi:hypothetical protein